MGLEARQAEGEPPRLGAVLRYLAGVAGLAFSITILWLSMRAVMGIGGSCASGGPFEPVVECPDAVVLLTPVSIFAGLLSAAVLVWGGMQLAGGWAALLALAWPALFLSLGWNFLEFGLRPPGGDPGQVIWSWLFCAIVFFVMGGGPLAVAIWGAREARRGGGASRAGSRSLTMPRGRYELNLVDRRPASGRPGTFSRDDAEAVADRLERLVRLRDRHDLTEAEFEAAKRATLEEADA
jgi:hypothetical protein